MSAPERIDPPETRAATCSCGRGFTQTRFEGFPSEGDGEGRWLPKTCEMCRGQDAEARRAAMEAQRIQAEETLRAQRLAALGVPTLFAGVSLESFQVHGEVEDRTKLHRVLQVARRYLGLWPDVEPLIVFTGAPGTGKGHVSWSIAKALTVHGAMVRVVKLPALIRDLREAWRDRQGPSEGERLRRYREPDLLVLDEVSRHALYGQPTQHLYDVIDDRLEWCRPTILTTNESDNGLAELLGGALLDRIQGGGGLLDFGDSSWRARPTPGESEDVAA
jgi:DNA replication protein DnaC